MAGGSSEQPDFILRQRGCRRIVHCDCGIPAPIKERSVVKKVFFFGCAGDEIGRGCNFCVGVENKVFARNNAAEEFILANSQLLDEEEGTNSGTEHEMKQLVADMSELTTEVRLARAQNTYLTQQVLELRKENRELKAKAERGQRA